MRYDIYFGGGTLRQYNYKSVTRGHRQASACSIDIDTSYVVNLILVVLEISI